MYDYGTKHDKSKANDEMLRQALDAVRSDETRFRTLASASFEGIVVSCEGIILDVNDQFVDMSGYTRDELVGTEIVSLIAPESKDIVANAIRTHRVDPYKNTILRKNGERLLVETRGRATQIGDCLVRISVHRNMTERRRSEEALQESEKQVRRKLDAILSPEADIDALELSDIIDVEKVQKLMDEFYQLAKIGIGIIDIHGRVLVGTGWQDICTKFHRINPESCKMCTESDRELSSNVPTGTFKMYRCKNNMWDIATPIMIGDKHVGNIFLGQFLFDDETPDYETFRQQARRFGFDEQEYIAALDRVPRWSRETVNTAMSFYTDFAQLIGNLSYSNIKLANVLEERKQAEEALRASEERFRTIFDSVNDAIFVHDRKTGAILDVNRRMCELYGYERDEALRADVAMLSSGVYPYNAQGAMDVMMKSASEGPQQMEWHARDKSGNLFWVEVNIRTAVLDGNERILVVVRDITERKEAEEAFRFTQYVMDNMPDETFWLSSDAHLLYVNKAACDDLSYTREELLNMTVSEINPTIKPDTWETHWRELRDKGGLAYESLQRSKDGLLHPVEVRAKIVEFGDKEYDCAFVRDIADRKRVEEELISANKTLTTIIESSPLSIVVLDRNGCVVSWNPAAETVYGWKEEEVIGRHAPYIIEGGEKDYDDLWRRIIAGEGFVNQPTQRIRKDGTQLDVDISAYSVRDTQGTVTAVISISNDTTERKRAVEALRQEKSFTDAILDSVPGLLYLYNDQGQLIRWNKKHEELGYSAEEMVNFYVLDWFSGEEDTALIDKAVKQAFSEGSTIVEANLVTKSGAKIFFYFTGVRLTIDDKLYMVGIGIDITERKHAENALKESEERLRLALTAANQGSYDLNIQTGEVVTSPEHAIMLGYDPAEFHETYRQWLSRIHSDDRTYVDEAFTAYVLGERPEYKVESRHKTRSGDWKWILTTGKIIEWDSNGNPVRMVGINTDITERKRVLEELALSNDELRTINAIIAETAAAADLKSVLDIAVDESLKIVGLEGGTICLLKPDDVFQLGAHRATSDETVADIESGTIRVGECLCGMCAKTGKPLILTNKEEVLRYATREVLRGENITFHAAFPLMLESKCVGVLCVFTRTDKIPTERSLKMLETVTKQIALAIERIRLFEEVKRNAEELEQRIEERTFQLETANKELEAFSYSVSHDLRTPLRAIDGFSLMILEDYSDKLDADGKEYLGRVRAASVKMGHLIDDILRLSRISRAQMTRNTVNLSEIVKLIAADLVETQPERRVDLVIQPNLTDEVDESLIKIALENLLGNAWKFTSRKEIARIEFGIIRGKGKDIYFVRDNGAGFDPRYAGKLFGAFQRLHSDALFPGTGVGLATVKRIIHMHGGEVWAEGEVDKGATFYFTLQDGA